MTGQTMLTVAVIVVLTIAVINANRIIVDSAEMYYQEEAQELAVGLAQALLSEAGKKWFDGNVAWTDTLMWPIGWLTASLGPEAGVDKVINPMPDVEPFKSAPSALHQGYNDIDDYNNYSRVANTTLMPGFIVSSRVTYVKKDNPEQPVSDRTYLKRMEVTVEHPYYLRRPVKLSRIFAY